MPFSYQVFPLGDHALTIELDDRIDEHINQQCFEIAALLSSKNIPGLKDIVPAYNTVSMVYDPSMIFQMHIPASPSQYMLSQVNDLLKDYRPSKKFAGRSITIPACFDLSFAPDLEVMAVQKDMVAEDIIQKFLDRSYRVYLIGFLPGFAYMGKVDDSIATARRGKPHLEVKAGSIGIAGNQTGIYPLASPGGWNIIGRTPLRLFDKNASHPCLLQTGDEITFQQISISEFNTLNQNS